MLSSCNELSSRSGPDNVIPLPNAIGAPTAVPDLRSIKGSELGHLARASRGRGTLLNIWATWCGSCKGELPLLRQVAAQYAPKGLQVVLVSVNEPEDQKRLMATASDLGFSPPFWIAARPLNEFKWALAKNWKGNIPVTFLYDAQGQQRFFWDGPVEADELRPVIEDFLAGKAVQGEKHFELAPGLTDPN